MTDQFDGASLDIKSEQFEKMKALFPEAISEGKVDWEKLKATLGEEITFANERYVLNWAGKSEAFRVLQTATLAPAPEESVNFDTTQNIFIEGENLEVLKVLQKSYYGKIKMIEIDPPYNTGSDSFIYPDKFSESKEDYLKRIGEKDEEGYLLKEGLFRKNSKENGQYHSNWLNMMYPRLFLARNLLREDGVIFVHIDDNEVHNLRLMMNEIFGEENFVSVFPWKKRSAKSDVPFGVSQDYEWVLSFTRGDFQAGLPLERKYYKTDDIPNDRWRLSDLTTQRSAEERQNSAFDMVDPKTQKIYPLKPNRVWGVTKDTFLPYYGKKKIVFPDDYDFLNITIPAFRVFESEDKAKAKKKFGNEDAKKSVSTFLPKEIGMSEDGNNDILELFNSKVFPYPKPVKLIRHFIQTIHEKDFIVLDFFAGSGTVAQAVLAENAFDGENRKFITVQLPLISDENSEAKKLGFETIAEISKERIKRVIKKIVTEKHGKLAFNSRSQDLGFKVFKLKSSNFKIWRGDGIENEDSLTEQLEIFKEPVREGAQDQNILYELILKSGFELTAPVKELNGYHSIANGELVIALNSFTSAMLAELLKAKPKRVIALDRLFAGDDDFKTNTLLQLKDAGVEFKTV